MKNNKRLISLVCIWFVPLLFSACSRVNDQVTPTPGPPTVTATPVPPTMTPTPTTPPTTTKQPSPSPTPTPDFSAISARLPAPLYYSAYNASCDNVQSVWRITPGASQVERVLPEDIHVSTFDIWPGDGRMAYGTTTGKLYVVMPGQEAQLTYQANTQTQQKALINCARWSPSGTRLAYCVKHEGGIFDDPESVAQESGLWILTVKDGSRVQLLKNQYLSASIDDVNTLRVIRDVVWSPDEQAMVLETGHWEWHDVYWLHPLEYSSDEANLHDPEGSFYEYGNWTNDSQEVLLSGLGNYGNTSNIVRVGRQSMEHTMLVDGDKLQVYTTHAQSLADKIVFLMWSTQSPESTQIRFYLGQQDSTGFNYTPTGPQNILCGHSDDIKLDSTGHWAALACGSPSPGFQVVSLDGVTDIDLTAMIAPLTSCGRGQVFSHVFWGSPEK